MLILKKRKLYIAFGIFIVTILAVQICIARMINVPETQETVALPVNKKVIVLDAGHGGEDRRGNHR